MWRSRTETDLRAAKLSWNNRIYKHDIDGDTFFALHEAYYDVEAGEVKSWTDRPVTSLCESVEDLITLLELQLQDANRFRDDVLVYPGALSESN